MIRGVGDYDGIKIDDISFWSVFESAGEAAIAGQIGKGPWGVGHYDGIKSMIGGVKKSTYHNDGIYESSLIISM